jgi:hypothetical protein
VPRPVTALILAPAAASGARPLEAHLDAVRGALAVRHAAAFSAAGADAVVVHRELPDDLPFGERLRRLVRDNGAGGLVVLGAGAIPLATNADRRAFVQAGRANERRALANNAYSADVIAIADAASALRDLPADLAGDNALPRWLAEVAGVPVDDLATRRDLAFDVDSPLDVLLLGGLVDGLPQLPVDDADPVTSRLASLRALAADPGAELLVAGRVNAADLRAIERGARARTRALIEERGLRTAALAAQRGRPNRRPPRSLLARLIEHEAPDRFGELVAAHADGALIDTRVLIAARAGADEREWPTAEDRYASDLLLADRVGDPWLRAITRSAAGATVPILLGAHTLVGPGAVLALGIERGEP